MTTPTSPDAGSITQDPSVAASPNSGAPGLVHKLIVGFLAVAFVVVPVLFRGGGRADADPRGNGLTGDGLVLVTRHEALQDCAQGYGALPETLTATWWGSIHPEKTLYRPLSTFALGLATAFAGPYDEERPGSTATPYFFLSLALLATCSLLVLELGWLLFKNANMALAGAALFATLPVHGEVLFDVAGMAELLCAAFSLAAWCAWVRSGQAGPRSTKELGIVALFTLLASLSKESAFALPLVFFLTDVGMAREGSFGAGVSHALERLPALALPIVALVASLGLRMGIVGGIVSEWHAGNVLDNGLLDVGALERVMNAFRMMGAGMLSMVGVNTLSSNWSYSPDYSLSQIEVLGAFAPLNLLGLVGVVGSIAAAILLYPRCRTRATLFLCVPAAMLLTSNLLFPVGTIYADRLLFFPSVALALFLAAFLGRRGTLGVGVALALSLGGGLWTHSYAQHWETQSSLVKYAADESATDSARAHHENGIALARRGFFSPAATSFSLAISRHEGMAEAYAHKALALFDADSRTEEAISDMRTALDRHFAGVEYQFADVPGHRPLEVAYYLSRLNPKVIDLALQQGRPQALNQQLAWLDGVLANGYESEQVHLRRADVLMRLDRFEEARAALETSWTIEPTPECGLTLGGFLERRELDDEALAVYTDAFNAPGFTPESRIELALARANIESARDPGQAASTIQEIRDDAALKPWFNPGNGESASKRFYRMASIEAISQLQQMIEEGATGPDQLERIRGKLQLAMRAHQQIDGDTYFTLHVLAHAHFLLGEMDDAKDLFERMLGVNEAPTQRIFLGRILSDQGELADARAQYEIGAGTLAGWADAGGDYIHEQDLLEARLALLFTVEALEGAEAAEPLFDDWDQLSSEDHDYVGVYARALWSARQSRADEAVAWANTFQSLRPQHELAQVLVQQAMRLAELEAETSADSSATWVQLGELAQMRYRMTNTRGAIESSRAAIELARSADVSEAELAPLRLLVVLAQRDLREWEEALNEARATLDEPDLHPALRADLESLAQELEAKIESA